MCYKFSKNENKNFLNAAFFVKEIMIVFKNTITSPYEINWPLKAISMALTHTENATRIFANFATKRLGNTLGGLETLKSLGKQLSLFIWQNLGKPFDCVLHVDLNKDIASFLTTKLIIDY